MLAEAEIDGQDEKKKEGKEKPTGGDTELRKEWLLANQSALKRTESDDQRVENKREKQAPIWQTKSQKDDKQKSEILKKGKKLSDICIQLKLGRRIDEK